MNERIKELAKEAALVYKIIPPPATHTTPLYLIDNFKKNAGPAGIEIISDGFCEKFAELIVRECMSIIKQGEGLGEEDDFDKGFQAGIAMAYNRVRTQMGVKE